jgi:hypothetical protein
VTPPFARKFAPIVLLAIAAAAPAYVMGVVARQTIDVVEAKGLLPRWDLATHLGHGWLDYHLLATGQIPRLLWDLWQQGYWPPALSIYQVPFYLLLGADRTAGLWSSPVAFVLTGVAGAALLWRTWGSRGVLPASLFLALLVSSPFLLAYASVTMTEMLGACAQVLVLVAYSRCREAPGLRTARWFALSLTLLFFTKYNYFLLLAVPLVIHEWLERTSGLTAGSRAGHLCGRVRRVLSSPVGAFVAVYLVAVLIVVRTGGFEFHAFGQRVSVRSVGNSGLFVLYVLLARLWYLHRRGRIDWDRLTGLDVRVRPLLVWFVVPVTIWLASPHPNHLRDFAGLVINHPMGEPSFGVGLTAYLDALRKSYFYSVWVAVGVVMLFGLAARAYPRQPAVMRLLILTVPLQFVAVALHQTRFPRFLLQTVVLLCLAAAGEVGRHVGGSTTRRVFAALAAVAVLAAGAAAARIVVTQERFQVLAFEHYTDSQALRDALRAIREELGPGDRLAVVGHSNELSPALFRWELGPPSGVPSFPSEIGGAGALSLSLATKVLLLEPLESAVEPLDVTSYYAAQRQAVLERVDRGEFVLRRRIPLADMHVSMRLYERDEVVR